MIQVDCIYIFTLILIYFYFLPLSELECEILAKAEVATGGVL